MGAYGGVSRQWANFVVGLVYESDEEEGLGCPVGHPGDMEFTTEVSIMPPTFPYPPFIGEDCKGRSPGLFSDKFLVLNTVTLQS